MILLITYLYTYFNTSLFALNYCIICSFVNQSGRLIFSSLINSKIIALHKNMFHLQCQFSLISRAAASGSLPEGSAKFALLCFVEKACWKAKFVDLDPKKVKQQISCNQNWSKFTASVCTLAGLPVISFKHKQCNLYSPM